MSSTGRVAVPVEILRLLRIPKPGRIRFIIDGEVVRIEAGGHTLESVRGFFPPLPNASADFDVEIAESMSDHADKIIARMRGA
ncbi:MAG: hypothetical protein ACR2OO_05795 [Thermomicrobiales bacterium]